MRTKTLAVMAALTLTGMVAAVAQSNAVYSVNVVGYVTKTVPAGWSMWVNPLNAPSNNVLSVVIPNPTPSTLFYKYTGTGYDSAQFDEFDLVWLPGGGTNVLGPGQGFWLFTAAPFDMVFVGEVREGAASNFQLRPGFNLTGSAVPQDGTLTSLQVPQVIGALVYKWNNSGAGGYSDAIFDEFDLAWLPADINVAMGEAFWLSIPGATPVDWVRNFTVPR